jgi:transcriptional regulator with XRE-family HTH domain
MEGITGRQLRAARAMLRWEQKQLAEASRVSVQTIKRLETIEGPVTAHPLTREAVVRTLEEAGIVFFNDDAPGVKLRQD